jgi:hypothetical protein
MERFLCIAGSARGREFLRQCAELDVRPTVLTLESLRDADWPGEFIEDLATMPADLTRDQVLNTVCWMARGRQFHRVIAFDEADLLLAAQVREHMRIPGMGLTTAGYYRDRLAMRVSARESGFPGPEFCRVLNYDELREFMEQVPAPWVLQPRGRESGAQATIPIASPEQLWRTLDQLGDLQSRFVLEQPLEGERFTVESVVSERQVVFSVVLRHSTPAGGVRQVETVDRTSRDWLELTALNGGLAPSLGMVRGVTQASFVRNAHDGSYCVDEIAAGVGAGVAAEVTEAASGLNLWREWARIEVAHLRGTHYLPNEWFEYYSLSLEWPAGVVAADAPELAARELVSRSQANGRERILLKSANLERIEALAAGLAEQIAAGEADR